MVLSLSKTKYMQLSSIDSLLITNFKNTDIDLRAGTTSLEGVLLAELYGTYIDHYLQSEENIKQVSASCYRFLRILRKLRNFLVFNIFKQLV